MAGIAVASYMGHYGAPDIPLDFQFIFPFALELHNLTATL